MAIKIWVDVPFVPGANTFLYIPLNSVDTYNNVGGYATYSNTQSGTITYQKDSSKIEVGEFSSAYIRNLSYMSTNSFTLAFWVKLSNYSGTIIGINNSGYSYSYRMYANNGNLYFFSNSNPVSIGTGWTFVFFRKTGNAVNYGAWGVNSSGSSTSSTLNISGLNDITFGDGITGAMSNIILEDKEWTNTELNNFYVSSKSNYS